MSSIAHRMNHIFGSDKKTFVMAMDHGSNFNVLPAMKYPDKIIREVAAAGADAFLCTVGMADKFSEDFLGRGMILRIDGGVSYLGDHARPMQSVVTPEDALRLGADAIISMGFPGSRFESDILSALSRNILQAHRWNLPVMGEMLPRGFEGGEDSRSSDNITFACRQGAELGADIIKTEYTGDCQSFHRLVESVYVPVVILGGAKKVPERELLREIKDAMNAGGAGVAMGRNIWSHEAPARYAAAIAKLIHEDCSVDAALNELTPKF
ncbi:MAG: class I fructose-bisphosphate aldolase [Acetanaerobacterium sp.]